MRPSRYFIVALLVLLAPSALCSRVLLGNEIFRSHRFSDVHGLRVALLVNPTSVFQDSLVHLVDEMNAPSNRALFDLALVLSPEHGFRGELQAESGDPAFFIDPITNLPVVSAYNTSAADLAATLRLYGISAVVVDLQDVGVRLYTFIWTMFDVLQAAAEAGVEKFIVLDRPNPLGGLVSGPTLNTTCCSSGYGKAAIPHTHGLTIGELSLLFNSQIPVPLPSSSLVVVRCKGWSRSAPFYTTFLSWFPPSPNIPTLSSALSYASSVFLEATTVSEGRGTTLPFTYIGAPFVPNTGSSALLLNARLGCAGSFETVKGAGNGAPLLTSQQACVRSVWYEPTFAKYNGTVVPGFEWRRGFVERTNYFRDALVLLTHFRDEDVEGGFEFDGSWFGHGENLIDLYMGDERPRQLLKQGISADVIFDLFEKDVKDFEAYRKQFMIYDD